MKQLLAIVGMAVVLVGCAAPPASQETAETETSPMEHGEAADVAPGDEVADEGFDSGETGELEPAEEAPEGDAGH
jgi:hypothetical protein